MTGIVCSMVGASFAVAAAEVIRKKKGITAVGNAQVDTAQSKFGGSSALFDGTGDRLVVNSSAQFGFSGDFTIEAWVRFTNFTNSPIIFDFRASSDGAVVKPTLYFSNTGVPTYYTNGSARITGSALSTGTWYHIALSRSSTSTKLFVDGTQVGTTYTDSNNYVESDLHIGEYPGGGFGLNGWVDEFRVSKSARYTANFTAPTAAFTNDDNTLLLMHMDGTDASTYFEDDNGLRAPIALIANGNAQIDTAQSKFGGSSYLGDGTGDYLRADGSISLGTGDFTIEMWARHSVVNTNQMYMDCRPTNVNGAYPGIFFLGSNSRPYYYFNTNTRITADSAMSANTWYHIAIVRASGVTKMYIGGTAQTTTYTDSSSISYSIAHIGASNDSTPAQSLNGWIDEVRVSNTARYTGNFTPSTTPFVNDTNTLMLVHMDGTDASTVFRDDNGQIPESTPNYNNDAYASYLKLAAPMASTANDVAYLITGTGLSSAATKTQGTSSNISGGGYFGEYTNSLLNAQTGQALTYALPTSIPSSASGTFVIEGWFAATDSTTNNNWCISSADSGGRFLFGFNTGSTFSFGSENNIGISTGWHHIAIVCDAGTKRFYYDGIYKGAWVSSNTGFSTLHVGQFNASDSADFRGRIQDLRVYVGSVKGYTGTNSSSANFSLPLPIIKIRSQKGIIAYGNAQVDTAQSKFGGASALFDGTDDYLGVYPATNLGTNNFTIELWFRTSAKTQLYPSIINNYVGGSFTTNSWSLFDRHDSNNTKLTFFAYNINSSNPILTSTTSISNGVWYHVAIVRSGTSIKMYLNGTEESSTTSSGSLDGSADKNIFIGKADTTQTSYNGWLDEIRISNTARYTANFTPATAPFQNDSNTLLLLHTDGTDASTVFFDDNGRDTTPTA